MPLSPGARRNSPGRRARGPGTRSEPTIPPHRHPLPPHEHPPGSPAGVPGPIITLTTDIGWAYASQMKGVILSQAPGARIVDITHEVPPQGILEGAFLARYCGARFPPGTIHVVIVDPGVGSPRQPLGVRCRDGSLLVGPDNGVLSPFARHLGDPQPYRLDPHRVAPGAEVSATFEGRDLFAPAAGRLARSVPLAELGDPTSMAEFPLPRSRLPPEGGDVQVLHVDHFGNAITDLPTPDFHAAMGGPGGRVSLHVEGRHAIARIVRTYSELRPGELGALGSSFGFLEFAVSHGKADRVLGVRAGMRVLVLPNPPRGSEGVPPPPAASSRKPL